MHSFLFVLYLLKGTDISQDGGGGGGGSCLDFDDIDSIYKITGGFKIVKNISPEEINVF